MVDLPAGSGRDSGRYAARHRDLQASEKIAAPKILLLICKDAKSRIPVGMRLLYCVGGEKRSVHDFQRVAGAFAKRLLDARLELCKTVIGDESKRGAGEAAAVNSHGALAV